MQIEEFMKTIKGLSDNTRRAYEQSLWQYDAAYKGAELSANGMQKFLNHYQPSSLHRHEAALKAYWDWLDPTKPWPFNRRSFLAPRQHKLRYVKPDVVMEMIEHTTNKDDHMFLRTLFMLGCRIHELKEIDEESLTDAGVVVKTKGGEPKLKVLTKDFMTELRLYALGKRGKLFPMSYNYYYCLLKRLGKGVGHPEVALHMIRHSRAVDLLTKGMKLPYLQQFLGHASINTTAIYTQVTGGELSQQLEELENGNSHRATAEILPEPAASAVPLRVRRAGAKKGKLAAPGRHRPAGKKGNLSGT